MVWISQFIDRVIVLPINTEEMQIETLLNVPVADACRLMTPEGGGKRTLPLGRLVKKPAARADIKSVKEVSFHGYTIRELETGSIEVERGGKILLPAKPVLRELAVQLSIGLLNSNGNALTTRQLGSQIIESVHELTAA